MKELTFQEFVKEAEPDLREIAFINRNPGIRFFQLHPGGLCVMADPKVNAICDRYMMVHTYDCCSSAPTVVYPNAEVEGYAVHSFPVEFMVGHHYEKGCGDVADYDLWRALKEAKIPDTILIKLEKYFSRHYPIDVDPNDL